MTEWALVTAFLAVAAAGAIAIFGDEIRAGLGLDAGARRPPAKAAGSPPPASREAPPR